MRYLGTRLCGKLSPDVRSAKILNTFKNKIRKFDIGFPVETIAQLSVKILAICQLSVNHPDPQWIMAARPVPSAHHSCVILSFLYQLFSDYHSIITLSDQLLYIIKLVWLMSGFYMIIKDIIIPIKCSTSHNTINQLRYHYNNYLYCK